MKTETIDPDATREERLRWWHAAKFGMFTCRRNIAYLTVFYYPGDYLIISKVGPGIRNAELLTTGTALTVKPLTNARWKISGLPAKPPGDLAPVIKIELEAPPYELSFSGADWLDGEFQGDDR